MMAPGLACCCAACTLRITNTTQSTPILSGIAHSEAALQRLNTIMDQRGYELKYDHEFETHPAMVEAKDRYRYFVRVYKMPAAFENKCAEEIEDELMLTRLALRADGEEHGNDLTAFSFWPDVAMIKEVGWPLEIGNALSLHDNRITSRVCMAQGRQNTNYGINLYACHPFFIQGIATMTNGENTAFVPIQDWLLGKTLPRLHRLSERLRGLRPYPPLRHRSSSSCPCRPINTSLPR